MRDENRDLKIDCVAVWGARVWRLAQRPIWRSALHVRDAHAGLLEPSPHMYRDSIARTFLKRRVKRSSLTMNLALMNALTNSKAREAPIIRAPRTMTFISSCSTP